MSPREKRRRIGIALGAAVIVPLTFGCNAGGVGEPPAQRPTTTPLTPGRYTGTADCTAVAQLAGETINAAPATIDVEAEIGLLGFPSQNGTAIDVGTVGTIDIFGGSLQGTITEIRLEGVVLVVVRELAGTFAEGIALHGNSVDEYGMDGGALTVSITTDVSAGAAASLRETCTGRLSRQ